MSGAPIFWSSKKQPIIAQSSCEAEYIALAQVSKDVRWIKNVLCDLGHVITSPISVLEDNTSAIAVAHQTASMGRSRHFEVRFHCVREAINHNLIQLQWIPTKCQLADILTKPLCGVSFTSIVCV